MENAIVLVFSLQLHSEHYAPSVMEPCYENINNQSLNVTIMWQKRNCVCPTQNWGKTPPGFRRFPP